MPWIGSIIPNNRAAGVDDKAHRLRRDRDEKRRITKDERGFARALDEAELASVEHVENVDEAVAPAPGETEQGREDREKRGFHAPPDPRGGALDIKG